MSDNPLLLSKTKLPGKVFQLPSKGLLYQSGILADTVQNGEIQVKAMSALTEMKIRSADLLISGKVIEEVCHECAPEILKPAKLVIKDVDALFCFLVIATYGDLKTVNTIHNCEKSAYHDYKISLESIVSKPNNEILDHRDVLFTKEISTGNVLHLKPVTFEASLQLTSQRQEAMRLETERKDIPRAKLERVVLDDLMSVIDSVDGKTHDGKVFNVSDKNQIEEWIRTLTRKQMEEIVQAGNAIADWGFNFNVPLTCKDCEQEFKFDLELNPVSFFSG